MHKLAYSTLTACCVMLTGTTPALAQAAGAPGVPPTSASYWSYIAAAVLFAAVCFAVLKDSNRSHQD